MLQVTENFWIEKAYSNNTTKAYCTAIDDMVNLPLHNGWLVYDHNYLYHTRLDSSFNGWFFSNTIYKIDDVISYCHELEQRYSGRLTRQAIA